MSVFDSKMYDTRDLRVLYEYLWKQNLWYPWLKGDIWASLTAKCMIPVIKGWYMSVFDSKMYDTRDLRVLYERLWQQNVWYPWFKGALWVSLTAKCMIPVIKGWYMSVIDGKMYDTRDLRVLYEYLWQQNVWYPWFKGAIWASLTAKCMIPVI